MGELKKGLKTWKNVILLLISIFEMFPFQLKRPKPHGHPIRINQFYHFLSGKNLKKCFFKNFCAKCFFFIFFNIFQKWRFLRKPVPYQGRCTYRPKQVMLRLGWIEKNPFLKIKTFYVFFPKFSKKREEFSNML